MEVNVTFFNDFGQRFQMDLKKFADDEMFLIIASAKVNSFEGKVYFTFQYSKIIYIYTMH